MAFDLSGLLTFSNFISVLAVMMIVSSCVWLFGLHFLAILLVMPIQAIELILYTCLSFAAYNSPYWFSQGTAFLWAFLFAAGLSATTLLTGSRSKNGNVALFYFVNMMIHGAIGVHLESTFICGVSVMFLMSLIGFEFGFGPGYASVGYSYGNREVITSATFASAVITFLGTFIRIHLDANAGQTLTPLRYAQHFVPGMLWFGPFVMYISILIISSKFYAKERKYVTNNILAILIGLTSVLIGNLYNIPQLSGFCGTIFVIYLLEKYCEIMPNRSDVWAFTTLLIGIILFVGNMYFRS